MTKKEFKQLRAEAGFKTDIELAEFLEIHKLTIERWNRELSYPNYVKIILQLCKNVQNLKNKFEYLMNNYENNDNNNSLIITIEEKLAIEKMVKLQIENNRLVKKIESLKSKIYLN